MTYIFWAILLNILVSTLSMMTTSYLKVDLSFLVSIAVFGLILKGLSKLNQTQRNLQKAKTLSIILLGISLVNGLMSLFESTNPSGGVIVLLMGSGIIALLNEYQLIKGIQSYESVLSDPEETIHLLKYWKTNIISSLVLGIGVFITAFAIGISFALELGPQANLEIESLLADPEFLLQVLRPSAPIYILLLIILTGALFVSFTTRILWFTSMYHIQKDHQWVLKKTLSSSTFE